MTPGQNLLNERQAAEYLNVSVSLVRKLRRMKAEPKYVRIGDLVRYRPEDLNQYVESLIQPYGKVA